MSLFERIVLSCVVIGLAPAWVPNLGLIALIVLLRTLRMVMWVLRLPSRLVAKLWPDTSKATETP